MIDNCDFVKALGIVQDEAIKKLRYQTMQCLRHDGRGRTTLLIDKLTHKNKCTYVM